MKISEVRGILAEILEVPVDPIKLGRELLILRDRRFLQQDSPRLLDKLCTSTCLEGIWEEFENILEGLERGPEEETRKRDITLLLKTTDRFFAQMLSLGHISRNHPDLREEIIDEKQRFLEAIEVLSQRI